MGLLAPAFAPWLLEAIDQASRAVYGCEAMHAGCGGTIPFMGMLGRQFPRTQFFITGVLGPHSNAHGPNEFLDVEYANSRRAWPWCSRSMDALVAERPRVRSRRLRLLLARGNEGPALACDLECLAPLRGVLAPLQSITEYGVAALSIGTCPFPDFLQRSKAAETGALIIQAAFSQTGGRGRAVRIVHSLNGPRSVTHWITASGRSLGNGSQKPRSPQTIPPVLMPPPAAH